jgi:hypothetical protein
MKPFRAILPIALVLACGVLQTYCVDHRGADRFSCQAGSLPAEIQRILKERFGLWRIQEPQDLNERARERWQSEKPLASPGIAVGRFGKGEGLSYAVLLVPRTRPGVGYKLLAFSPESGGQAYRMVGIEESGDSKAANLFIHGLLISKFFDQQSRIKFGARANDGILFADVAEDEYETDIYFWADGQYRHEPIDY